MHNKLIQYARFLHFERAVHPSNIGMAAQNETFHYYGNDEYRDLAAVIIQRLDCACVIVAAPFFPFSDLLIQRADHHQVATIVPQDSESKTFLHDIPVIPADISANNKADAICTALETRKGCFVSGTGIISRGDLTVEQAYIAWSSLYHAATIKYFEDVLAVGPHTVYERAHLEVFEKEFSEICANFNEAVYNVPLTPDLLKREMYYIGRKTIQLGLVDSFFGNASCRLDNQLFISQTSARLDELHQHSDLVTYDKSSTAGITASSELPAHLAIFNTTDARCILHGHPKFSVIMSYVSVPSQTNGISYLDDIPVVSGDGGTGELAENLSLAFSKTKAMSAIVRGHGVFSISEASFSATLKHMIRVENQCRQKYFSTIKQRYRLF